MKTIQLLTFFFVSTLWLHAQEETILEVFNDQIKAFDAKDIDRLVDNVSQDFKYYYVTADELILEVEGKEKFRESMQQYFAADMKVNSVVESYIIQGNKISFKEVVTYTNKEGKRVSASSMGVYQIVDGKIKRSWYFTD